MRDPAHPQPPDGLPLVPPDAGEEENADEIDNAIPTYGYHTLPVVALGGSAGSIPALRKFFERTPADSGLVYVVVLHLAPEHESTLPALLQRHSAMPVYAAEDAAKLERNTVYVIPPGHHLTLTDGHLRLTDLQAERGRRVAVDLFFRSLADTHGPQATAVVLSGADGDGAIGLKRIKERGGLTIAQDPEEAEHGGMPSSAIGTGMVDWILPVDEMPARVLAYYERAARVQLPPEDGPQPAAPAAAPLNDSEALLREVLNVLRTRTGRDFSYYKRATIVRRVARRMQVSGKEDLAEYLGHLRTHPGEAGALLQDLLISVTNFFRDREAFAAVEASLPEVFANKRPGDPVRVWCAACATGEEAYSMAMLLLEHTRKLDDPPVLQVFGCDLDDEAIQTARAGFYPGTIAADVSEERLRRFFTKEPGGYRVRRELREMVLFASHDLLKDAPFSRMDLISCRNLLIYLNPDAQKRALEIFNFALKGRGLLFLGASETVEEGSALFTPLDKKHRVYRHRAGPRAGLPVPTSLGEGTIARVVRQHEHLKNAQTTLPGRGFLPTLSPGSPERGSEPAAPSADELHFRLVGRFGPPSIVVNAEHDIVHLSENANRFLQFPEGEPTRNLLRLIYPALRVDLRAALLRAKETGEQVEILRRLVELPGGLKAVDVSVSPAGDLAPDFQLVMFETHELNTSEEADDKARRGALEPASVVLQLERELTRANFNLRATVEQYEASTEELKASNEELQAMNEELRSAGEELETGREELQSLNEELATVNAELKHRVEELGRANSDLQHLMNATPVATVFLDRDLLIMRYTPAAVPLFNLIPGDVGRPIADLKQRIENPEMIADAERVLRTLVPVERELRDDGRVFLARVLPYRTVENVIAGVVFSLMDITEHRHTEEELRTSEAWLSGQKTAFQAAVEGVPLASSLGILVRTAVKQIGHGVRCGFYVADEAGKELRHVAGMPDSYAECVDGFKIGSKSPACGLAVHTGQPVITPDVTAEPLWQPWRWLAERYGFRACWSFPIEAESKVVGSLAMYFPEPREATARDHEFAAVLTRAAALIISHCQEAEERARAEHALRESETRFRNLLQASSEVIYCHDANWSEMVQLSGGGFLAATDGPDPEWLNRHIPAGEQGRVREAIQEAVRTKGVFQLEHRVVRADGTPGWAFSRSTPLLDEHGEVGGWFGAASDVTARHEAEEALATAEEWLRLIVDSSREHAIISLDLERRVESWNPGAALIFGYTPEEVIGTLADLIFTPEDRAAGLPVEEMNTALREGRAGGSHWLQRKDGSRFWTDCSLLPMRPQPGGPVVGLVKILRDETAKREARQALERSQQELLAALQETERARAQAEAAGMAKDHFLAVLSHELRTPLTPVLMAVHMLARHPEMPDSARETLAMVERNVQVEARFIDGLLDVTKISHGKLEIMREPTDLHEAVRRAVEVAAADAGGKRQPVSVTLEADSHEVLGDATRLQQVFWNLLKNASKFTPEGGEIRVASRNEPGRIVVEVADTGIGFEPGGAARLFEAFTQASQEVTRKFGGLGLGLAIAKAIVAAHDGELRARSEGAGRGATFAVDLPLLTPGRSDPAETARPESSVGTGNLAPEATE